MAKRRMFLTEILESDLFLELAPQAQLLYVHLCMHADDEGFLGGCKSVVRLAGAEEADLTALEDAGFLLRFSSGVRAVRHWRAHNLIRADRFVPTRYQTERAQVCYDETEGYCFLQKAQEALETAPAEPCPSSAGVLTTICQPSVATGKDRSGKVSIGQVSVGKERLGKDSFSPHKAEEEKERKINGAPAKADAPVFAASAAKEETDISVDALSSSPQGAAPPVAVLPLSDAEPCVLRREDLAHYRKLYPAVDVKSQLLKMQGWCEANPDKRRSSADVRRFIAAWLSREADKAAQPETTARAPNAPSYDIDLAEQKILTTVPALKKRR